MKKKLLLHICCAPCATYVVQVLSKDYEVTGYFYNPNIYPEEEYFQRLNEMKRIAEDFHITLLDAPYDPMNWFALTKGLEHEPERGTRCERCFYMRLEETAEKAKKEGFDIFATTLSISPYKNASVLNRIGQSLSERYDIAFLPADFKKNDGFKKSVELCKKYNLYRQDYCGCIYSKKRTPSR
jgi:predicted adenine nucleotide alpha hydrolase (AANH) superfamily ATPase